jgi:hypothetical protein
MTPPPTEYPRLHYCVHSTRQLVPILTLNEVHTFTPSVLISSLHLRLDLQKQTSILFDTNTANNRCTYVCCWRP